MRRLLLKLAQIFGLIPTAPTAIFTFMEWSCIYSLELFKIRLLGILQNLSCIQTVVSETQLKAQESQKLGSKLWMNCATKKKQK